MYSDVKMTSGLTVIRITVTTNVETVVLLSKGEIDSKKIKVKFSMENMDMPGFRKGVIYEQIKAYASEKWQLKVSNRGSNSGSFEAFRDD